jgi:hypothetical protein
METQFAVDHERDCIATEAYQGHQDKPQMVRVGEALRHAF